MQIISTAKADYGYDLDNGASLNFYATNWLQYGDNAYWTTYAFENIYDLFYYQYENDYPVYGHLWNWETDTTPNIVTDQIDDANDNHWFASVLYVGHGGPDGFYGYASNPTSYDPPSTLVYYFYDISVHADDNDVHQFVFNWVCKNANYSPNGAPYDWNPQYWSYPPSHPPYTFIGFDDSSPWLMDEINESNNYAQWLVFFYYYALDHTEYSIKDALDAASYATDPNTNWGTSLLGTGTYESYFPYDLPPYYNTSGWWSGKAHVAGDPLGTYLPIGAD